MVCEMNCTRFIRIFSVGNVAVATCSNVFSYISGKRNWRNCLKQKLQKCWNTRTGNETNSNELNSFHCVAVTHKLGWHMRTPRCIMFRNISCSVCGPYRLTAPFNDVRILNFKAQRQMRLSLPSIKCSLVLPSFRIFCPNCVQQFHLITALGSSRKFVGTAEHLMTVAKNPLVG